MKATTFSKALKQWRGSRLQKEAADVLDVKLRTYEGWELGRNPSRYAINEIQRRMTANPERKTKCLAGKCMIDPTTPNHCCIHCGTAYQ